MKIECPACHKSYDIPDERLPMGQKISLPCPSCKAVIDLDLTTSGGGGEADVSPEGSSGDLPSGEELKNQILKTVKDLPPMPQTVFKAREILSDKNSSFEELAGVLETDQAIAAKVLRLSNSAFYGLMGQVTSIQHASVVLGYKTLGELITMAGTSSVLGGDLEGYKLGAGDLWQHSLGVAFGSKIIAEKRNPSLADDAFSAGLIHDSGKLVLNQYLLQRSEAFEAFMANGQESFLRAEREILGFDHAEIASELCLSWKVPEPLISSIRYHHRPADSNKDDLAYVVHVADAIAMMSGIGAGIDGMLYEMDDGAMAFLGLREEDLHTIMGKMAESVSEIVDQGPSE